MSRLFLVRHGEPELTEEGLFLGQSDVLLSARGREEAKELGESLRAFSFGAVYSSDLIRAAETARIVVGSRPLSVIAAPALREVALGDWELRRRRDVEKEDPRAYRDRGRDLLGFRPPRGESFRDLAERALPLLRGIMGQNSGDSLVVTHAGVLRLLFADLLGLEPERLFRLSFDYASLSLLRQRNGKKEILCLNWRPRPALP
ncbi:histidine phosphatase family protein [Aminithiophilus ramosus]|uniref:phosphoglycerate mutase (2,3-diphosphoglycerate-dependent) n=2 Tax=Synergistales TaxID=649776 RepID=A0A9Q7AJ77_9BACT|nr:histidine phosphatase family protein [Aminithiophilus ramosus]QTX32675.1 histidine phosphatase family protein [Aminithiophilus ramosus]QVL36550.1 histidine phosphatase family protein [Synergistota bacterium]